MIPKPRTLLILALRDSAADRMIRRILWGTALATVGIAALPASAPSRPRSFDLVQAGLRQHGPLLIMKARTSEEWRPDDLGAQSICLELRRPSPPVRRVCAVGPQRLRLRYDTLNRDGTVRRSRLLAGVRVRRPDLRSVAASFDFRDIRLHAGGVRWRVFSSPRSGCATPQNPASCEVSIPASGFELFRIRRPRILGCTRHGPALRRHGNPHRRDVAVTFDDGPSAYTLGVLRVLRRFHAQATFFLIGAHVRSHPALARRELRDGEELGNHTLHHSLLPSRRDLRATNEIIHRATGFQPCDFRPPDGAVNGRVVRAASSLDMTTVVWDVDPRDWSRPGAPVIARRVLAATHPGDIVIMHDGGGPRGETVAALPRILRGLERRHYRIVTVSRLLGERERLYPR